MFCPDCGDAVDREDVCRGCGACEACCECDTAEEDDSLFTAAELGLDPEEDSNR